MQHDRSAPHCPGNRGQAQSDVERGARWGTISKMLVRPETVGSRLVDFRISTYQPMSFVEPHTHRIQEQIYHVVDGEGLMELDGERRVMRAGDYAFVPPGVEHAIYNTGRTDLTFFVVTAPPDDE